MKKLLKYILAAVLITINILVVAVLVILNDPNLVLNERVVKRVLTYIPKSAVDISWKTLNLNTISYSLLQKEITLDTTDFCLKTTSIDGCLENANLAVRFNIRKPLVVISIGPAEITSSKITYTRIPPKLNVETKDSASFNYKKWFDLQNVQLGPADIKIDQWVINLQESSHSGNFYFTTKGQKGLKDFYTELVVNKSPFIQYLKVSSQNNNDMDDGSGLWKGDLNVEFKLPNKKGKKGVSGNVAIKIFQEKIKSFDAAFTVRGVVKPKDTLFKFYAGGNYEGGKLALNLNSDVKTGIKQVPRVQTNSCQLGFFRDQKIKSMPAVFDVDCRLIADVVLPIPPQYPHLDLPKSTGSQIKAHIVTAYPPSIDKDVSGNIGVILDPILTPLFKGSGKVNVAFSGIPSKFPDYKIDADTDINLTAPDFQKIVSQLDKTIWGVPAPFNVLQGSVSAGIKGKFNLFEGQFPVYAKTDLNSKYQKVQIDSVGDLYLNTSSFINSKKPANLKPNLLKLEVALSNITIALPRLKLEKPPALIADRRMDKIVAEIEKKIKFDYAIHVVTPVNTVKVITNLAKSTIPIGLNLNILSDEPFSGTVSIGNFPVELFRRNAVLESLQIAFRGKETPLLSGSVSVSYTDYNMKIKLTGTVDKPVVTIVSDPPLTQDQAISVLIFGRALDDLDSSQQESVGNTQSALADRTVGLASLYLLASTPIESLGYDQTTGEVTAKVHITDGTSLNLGTSSAGESIGLRRRLTKNLVITTDYNNANSSGTTSTTSTTGVNSGVDAFLEWTKRY